MESSSDRFCGINILKRFEEMFALEILEKTWHWRKRGGIREDLRALERLVER